MGGGDLNSKKAWHPNTLKNQERVWKAEQAAAEEKKRIVELEHERQLERERTELNKLAKGSLGSTSANNDDRLHWMYEKPDKKVQQEEYLLGRAIDKNQEQAGKFEQDEIPAVSRRVVGSSMLTISGDAQVDLVRKLREDPLLLVKERERAARAALLNNPVQRARLTELLRKEQDKKKEGKSKKKKKNDKDLDNILSEKLQALGGKKGIDLATLLASDDSSSESSEKKSKKKKKKKKEKKVKSKKDISSDSELEDEKPSKHGSKKELNKLNDSKKKRKSTNDSDDDLNCKRKRRDLSVEKKKAKADSKRNPKDSTDDYQSSDDEQKRSRNYRQPNQKYSRDEQYLKGNRYWNHEEQTHDNHCSISERESKHGNYSRDSRPTQDKKYTYNTNIRSRNDEYSREDQRSRSNHNYERERYSGHQATSLNDKERKIKKRSGLSEEEKSAKLAEMAAAGAEREKQRERRVAEQLLEKDRADRAPINHSRPRNLISQLPESLESRIHSNRHYIQRDQRHMNENFARR